MLAQFSVENYLSLKNRTILNLTASISDNEHPNNFVSFEKTRCLKSAVIYGANASGKSNLLKAMTAAILIVRGSNSRQIGDMIRVVPFRFDEKTAKKPTAFEFIIYIDGTQYIYGFSATKDRIVDEYLYVYYSSKRSMIFERTDTNNYHFNKADEKEFNDYVEKNTDNKLFLSTATAWNCQKTKSVFLWFAKKVDTYTDDNLRGMPNTLRKLFESESNAPELRRFTLNLLKNADINIDDYGINKQQIEIPSPIKEIIGGQDSSTAYNVFTSHSMPNNQQYNLDLSEESLGTQNLFCISPFIHEALVSGKTLFIDEMSCLHSSLVQYLVGLFNDPNINQTDAQLIFVTHDTILLDLKMFRRDQIYFIEKDEYGVSSLYSLDNFSVRKTENIRTAYLIGRYGAVPIVRSGALL